MIEARYHGYPQPSLGTSEVMRLMADGAVDIVLMPHTLEPFLLDSRDGSRYAVPEEVDALIGLVCSENRKHRQERLRNEQCV